MGRQSAESGNKCLGGVDNCSPVLAARAGSLVRQNGLRLQSECETVDFYLSRVCCNLVADSQCLEPGSKQYTARHNSQWLFSSKFANSPRLCPTGILPSLRRCFCILKRELSAGCPELPR